MDHDTGYDSPRRRRSSYPDHTEYRHDIRTLFISGFPEDVKERELHNLFRFFIGYEGCILNAKEGKSPVAFVSFIDRGAAMNAIRCVQSLQFDTASAQLLRVDFAKSNSKTKKFSANPPPYPEPAPDFRYFDPYREAYPSHYWSVQMPPRDSNSVATPQPPPPPPQDMNLPPPLPPHYSTHAPTPTLPPVSSRLPPCSTLFVGNLPKNVHEIELQRMFRSLPGFLRMKSSTKNGLPILFLEFHDEHASTHAMQMFQNHPWSEMRLRVDYAKAKMGESRRRAREVDPGDERAAKRQNIGESSEHSEKTNRNSEGTSRDADGVDSHS